MTRHLPLLVLLAVGCSRFTPAPTDDPPAPHREQIAKPAPVPKAAPPAAADWPVFRGTPQGTGVGTATLPDELDERWVFKCKDSVEGAPAVVNGVVYIASTDKHLYALDVSNGNEIWKTKLGIMKAAPAVKGGKVYVGDVGGTVFCVDAKTGKKEWEYVPEVGGSVESGCNFHGDNILVAAQGMPVLCMNPKGEKVWEFPIDGGSNGCPTVSGDVVFASGCDSRFHAIDAVKGTELWAIDIPGQAAATVAVADDVAYVGTVTNQVLAIDLKAKQKLWEFEPKVKSQAFYSSAALTDDLVILGSRDSKLYALDRKTGVPVWTFVTEGMVDPSPVVAGGRVYVGCLSLTAEFYALDAKTGKKKQELTLEGAASGSPAVGPDCIVVGTEKGRVYCLGKK